MKGTQRWYSLHELNGLRLCQLWRSQLNLKQLIKTRIDDIRSVKTELALLLITTNRYA